jgi:hypothetical protein
VIATGAEAIPLAMTWTVLAPVGVRFGIVNLVDEVVPGATDTELHCLVRA